MTCKQATEFEHGAWATTGPDLGQVIGHNCDGRVILRFGKETRVVHPSRLELVGAGETSERATCEFCMVARRAMLLSLGVSLVVALVISAIWTLL